MIFGIKARRVGGIEMHTRELAVQLGELGWQVVLCFHQEPSPEVRQYLSLPNVTWDELPEAWRNSKQTCLNLFQILRRHRPRLLHLQFTPFLGLNAWIARLCGVRKIVFTDHGSSPEDYQPRRQPAWKRMIAGLLNAPISLVIAVSDFNLRALTVLGTFPASRMRRVYNGADLARRDERALAAGARFRAEHKIPADRVLVTQVSWIRPEKGVPDVLRAAKLALELEPSLHFAFVGDGDYREQYSRLAEEYGIAEKVTWAGLIADPMGDGVFAATDIACQASRWQEAFGLVIAEAMAFGKPVVATRAGGIPEVVEDGVTGILTERGDAPALAKSFVLLARDPEMRNRMGQSGRKRAENMFDLERNVRALVLLYRDFSIIEDVTDLKKSAINTMGDGDRNSDK
jgi:glycosyltransferase involved in cell wall biosynthesis